MKYYTFFPLVALVGQLAAASPIQPYHMTDICGYAVEQIKLGFKATPLTRPNLRTNTANLVTQNNAPWGLARISHRPKLTFGTFNKYIYDSAGWGNVDVYILDSGINVNDSAFEGRAIWGANVIDDDDTDVTGAGTHYAGTVASRSFGVSKHANVIAVKTLGPANPNVTAIIAGIKWTIEDHEKRAGDDKTLQGAVIMLAAGALEISDDLTKALDDAYDGGIHVVISAGDFNGDACNYAAGPTRTCGWRDHSS